MKGLTYSFPARVTAVFLMFFSTMAACYSAVAVGFSYILGFYSLPRDVSYTRALMLLEGTEYSAVPEETYTNFFETIYNLRYHAIALFVVSVVLLLILIIFLMVSAGRREGFPGPHLNVFDRIPLDLFTVILGFAILADIGIILELPWYIRHSGFDMVSYPDGVILLTTIVGVGAALAVLMLTWYCTSLAARVKAGKWWRNSIIYMVLRGIFKIIRGIFRGIKRLINAISATWRAAFLLGALLFVQLIFVIISVSQQETVPFFVVFIISFALFAIIVISLWQMKLLSLSAKAMASGDQENQYLDVSLLHGPFKEHGKNLNSISQGIALAVEEQMRSERLKTELITNVSHDIKTPLTSISNYVDLLGKATTEEERREYLDVLARQSARLKKLTEDLVEASKASTGAIALELMPTNAREIIDQALAEYSDKLRDARLMPICSCPESLSVIADGRLLWRVLDNLLNNAVKYAQPGTRLYIDAAPGEDGTAKISIKNISRDILNISAEELMERFVRGDTARSTEGSGLGLNIARSLVELMGGTFRLYVDGDLFKAELTLLLTGGYAL